MKFENKFAGMNVKQILVSELKFSRKAITSLKARPDGILINGKHATVRAMVNDGDILEINFDDVSSDEKKLVPSSSLPEIIYEDEEILAVNKSAFMPTHQSQGHFFDTLANSVANYYASIERPFVFRSVNRLDKNTSGAVLIAKDRIAASRLSEQMKQGNIKKTYLAILSGTLPSPGGVISTYIRRETESIITRCVCDKSDEGARTAVTEYEVIATDGSLSLVLAMPVTGRTHQLRVHFSHIGAPILGDGLYGTQSELIDRHALHALCLSFTHPTSNKPMKIVAPIPDDMKRIIEEHFGKELAEYEQQK